MKKNLFTGFFKRAPSERILETARSETELKLLAVQKNITTTHQCPITGKILCDPVDISLQPHEGNNASTKSLPITFEREAIEKWISEGNRTHPLATNDHSILLDTTKDLVSNITMRNEIANLLNNEPSLWIRDERVLFMPSETVTNLISLLKQDDHQKIISFLHTEKGKGKLPTNEEITETDTSSTELPITQTLQINKYNIEWPFHERFLTCKLKEHLHRNIFHLIVEHSSTNVLNRVIGLFEEVHHEDEDWLIKTLSQSDDEGWTPFTLSIKKSKFSIAEYFIKCFVPEALFLMASWKSDEQRHSVQNQLDEHLILATKNEDLEIVEALITLGANTDAKDKVFGSTCLHLTAPSPNVRLLALLLKADAEVDSRNSAGATPLIVAGVAGERDNVEVLLRFGANTECALPNGDTALLAAVNYKYGKRDVIEVLLQYGANIEAKNSHGNTALSLACKYGNRDVVGILLVWGAVVDSRNVDGDTPIILAARHSHGEILRMLLSEGADIRVANTKGETIMNYISKETAATLQKELEQLHKEWVRSFPKMRRQVSIMGRKLEQLPILEKKVKEIPKLQQQMANMEVQMQRQQKLIEQLMNSTQQRVIEQLRTNAQRVPMN